MNDQEPSQAERDNHLGELIDRRVQVYGNPVETFARIAQMWTGLIGHEIQPWEVPLMMAAMKMVRADVMPDYSDNSDDIDGYLDIFRKIIGDDMIHARTVNEFIAKKWPAHVVDIPTPVTDAIVDASRCIEAGWHQGSNVRHSLEHCPAEHN